MSGPREKDERKVCLLGKNTLQKKKKKEATTLRKQRYLGGICHRAYWGVTHYETRTPLKSVISSPIPPPEGGKFLCLCPGSAVPLIPSLHPHPPAAPLPPVRARGAAGAAGTSAGRGAERSGGAGTLFSHASPCCSRGINTFLTTKGRACGCFSPITGAGGRPGHVPGAASPRLPPRSHRGSLPPGSSHVSAQVRLTPTCQLPTPRAIWGMHAPAPRVYTAEPFCRWRWQMSRGRWAPRRAAAAGGYKSLRGRGVQGWASGRKPAEDGERRDWVLLPPPPALAAPAGLLAVLRLLPVRGAAQPCSDGPALGPQVCALLATLGARAGRGGTADRPQTHRGEWGAGRGVAPPAGIAVLAFREFWGGCSGWSPRGLGAVPAG